jgi:hypothetical protein
MANNNEINLGSLDYIEIKRNLLNYLQNQDEIKDFNYAGSVMNSVVSLLAYNTLYYAMYSNVLANEMFLDSAQREESVVSLLKPLGVKIPTKTSAMAIIQIGGVVAIPKYTRFTGTSSTGINYSFYTLEDYVEAESGSEFITNIKLYQARQLVKEKDITSAFDFENQSYFIGDSNVDINTLTVEVDVGDGVWRLWTELDNIGDSTENLSQTIYFVERFDTGFEIQFGKENTLGNKIEEDYRIRISYLVSSGSAGNNIVSFSTTELTYSAIEVISGSSGGLDSPDLSYYKFIAPKFFAAQNRAVTKDDFLAISSEYLKSKGYNVTKSNFNAFGGEEFFPPKYGRVFVTTDILPREDILDLVAYLKTKCTLSILPEFVESESRLISYDVKFVPTNSNLTQQEKNTLIKNIRDYLVQNYSYTNQYNIDLRGVEDALISVFPINSATLKIKFSGIVTPNIASTILNFDNNEIEINEGLNTISNNFQDKFSQTVYLRVFKATNQAIDGFIDLRTFIQYPSTTAYDASKNYGRINIASGILELYNISNSPVNLFFNFKNNFFKSSSNIKYTIAPDRVELI